MLQRKHESRFDHVMTYPIIHSRIEICGTDLPLLIMLLISYMLLKLQIDQSRTCCTPLQLVDYMNTAQLCYAGKALLNPFGFTSSTCLRNCFTKVKVAFPSAVMLANEHDSP